MKSDTFAVAVFFAVVVVGGIIVDKISRGKRLESSIEYQEENDIVGLSGSALADSFNRLRLD